jgi:hypothetical protein
MSFQETPLASRASAFQLNAASEPRRAVRSEVHSGSQMDRFGSTAFSRVLVSFGTADARESYLHVLRQSCAFLEMRTHHRMNLVLGRASIADLDGLLLVDEPPLINPPLPSLVLDPTYSMEETLEALEQFLDSVCEGQDQRHALRRNALLEEAEATLSRTELEAFWKAVDTWHWPEPQQELVLRRGMRIARENQVLTATGRLRDSLSGRFAWRKVWDNVCA